MRSATLKRLTAIAIFSLAGSAYAQQQQPMATRTEAFRGIANLINHPRSVWWDALGLPSFGRGTDKGWVNDRQIDLKKPIYEMWDRAGGLGMTVFWNPSAMAEKAPTGYDIKKQIEGGKTTVRDYFDSRDPFNSRYNPLAEKIVFWTEQQPMTLSEAREIASYCGLQYNQDLNMFLDQSGKASGKYYDDGGATSLEINIKR